VKVGRILKTLLLSATFALTTVAPTIQPTVAYADEQVTIAEGAYGTFFNWKLTGESEDSDDLTLHFWGTGNPPSGQVRGWDTYRSRIKNLSIEGDIYSLPTSIFGSPTNDPNIILKECKKVTMTDSIEVIQNSAFLSCTGIEEVVFSKNLKTIEYQAFNNCTSLHYVELPEGLETIGGGVFNGCRMQKIILPEGIKYIDPTAFGYENPLCELYVPSTYNGNLGGATNLSQCSGIYVTNNSIIRKLTFFSKNFRNISNKDNINLLIPVFTSHINASTTVYTQPDNPIVDMLSSTGCRFVYVEPAEITSISDNNVTLDDTSNIVRGYGVSDDVELPILGDTDAAVMRLSVPTEIVFIISPQTQSKFITHPFSVVNETGAPIKFTLKKIEQNNAQVDNKPKLNLLARNYNNRTPQDWLELDHDETIKGIALKCNFDPNGGENFTDADYEFWETPLDRYNDKTEIVFDMDANSKITGKLGGYYGLAWDDDYSSTFKLIGTVSL